MSEFAFTKKSRVLNQGRAVGSYISVRAPDAHRAWRLFERHFPEENRLEWEIREAGEVVPEQPAQR